MKKKQATLDDVMALLKEIKVQVDALQVSSRAAAPEAPKLDFDELFEEAKTAVIDAGKASTSYIQRKLGVGYSRAAQLMDMLEQKGVIGAARGAKPREVVKKG